MLLKLIVIRENEIIDKAFCYSTAPVVFHRPTKAGGA